MILKKIKIYAKRDRFVRDEDYMRVVIIDSGVNSVDNRKNTSGIAIETFDGKQVITDQIDDEIGHGTVVTDIFQSHLQGEYQLFIIKVFSHSYKTSEQQLCAALNYITENLECSLVLISAGIRVVDSYLQIEACINTLVSRNVVIVAAFDNSGAVSYPAAFAKVIGVDTQRNYKEKGQFALITNSYINILGSNTSFRANGLLGKKTIVRGSSYTAAYIASIIAQHIIEAGHNISYEECIAYLRQMAANEIVLRKVETEYSAGFMQNIKKAIAFPFNKEMHSLARFESMLSFEMCNYYVVKYSGMIGSRICDIFPYIVNNKKIEDYLTINWQGDFDTIVLGHVQELSELIGLDLQRWFVEKCHRYKKKIYCFDNIDVLAKRFLDDKQYFYPAIRREMFPENFGGKLHLLRTPVLGVWGTSSKQGKNTLQILLRDKFLKDGYKVSQLGTEPSGYLLGYEYVYPMGYNSTVYVQGNEAVGVLNNIMHRLDLWDSDIIIVGSQSGTIPRVNYNIKYLSVSQMEFLLGTQPDIVILCINIHDDISYIEKTQNFIESICNGKVIAYCLSPLKATINNGIVKRNKSVDEEEAMLFAQNVKDTLGKAVYVLNKPESIEYLYRSVLSYLKAF